MWGEVRVSGFSNNGAQKAGSGDGHRSTDVYIKSRASIGTIVPCSLPSLKMSICEGFFSKEKLFGKVFLGHITLVGEIFLWSLIEKSSF